MSLIFGSEINLYYVFDLSLYEFSITERLGKLFETSSKYGKSIDYSKQNWLISVKAFHQQCV